MRGTHSQLFTVYSITSDSAMFGKKSVHKLAEENRRLITVELSYKYDGRPSSEFLLFLYFFRIKYVFDNAVKLIEFILKFTLFTGAVFLYHNEKVTNFVYKYLKYGKW